MRPGGSPASTSNATARAAATQRRLVIAVGLSAGLALLWWVLFYGNLAIDTDRGLLTTYAKAFVCLVVTTADCAALSGAVGSDPFLIYSPWVFVVTFIQLALLAVAFGSLPGWLKITIYRVFALEAILVLWWIGSSTSTLVPGPAETWDAARVLVRQPRLWHAIFGIDRSSNGELIHLGSVLIYFLGFGLAAVAGIVIGLLLGGFRPFGRTMEIYVNGLMATPRIAFIPLITVVLGIFWEAKVFIIFLGAVMPVIVNTYAGVLNADGELVEMARSAGASRLNIFRRILLPGSLPFIVVGLRLGATIGLINTVVAELYVSVSGLGGLLSEYRGNFRMAQYSVIVVVLAILGIVVTQSLRLLERRMDRWRYKG